jgi:arylsulfatase A-like enzyme
MGYRTPNIDRIAHEGIGWAAEDPTIAELLKPLGYATGQFGKNHFATSRPASPSTTQSRHCKNS